MKLLKLFTITSLIVLVVTLATSTIVEKIYGTLFVNHHVYESWWFVALWCIATCLSVCYCIKCKFHTRTTLLIHIAFLIILVGAFTSFCSSERGTVHLRMQKPCDELPFRIILNSFDVEYYQDSDQPKDFKSTLTVDGESYKLSMNKIITHKGYRLYLASFDSDMYGTTLLVNYDPYGTTVTYIGYAILFISLLLKLLSTNGKQRVINISAIAVALLAMIIIWICMQRNWQLQPILRSAWFPVHVSLVSVSYLIFAIMAISGISGIIYRKWLTATYSFNQMLLYPALFTLAMGIFVGAVWANVSWGRYWGWDPKEVWALITLIVYATAFHKRSFPFLRNGISYNIFIVISFFCIIITYFGVSLLGGMHSYS